VLELCSGGSMADLLAVLAEKAEKLSEDEIKAVVSYWLMLLLFVIIIVVLLLLLLLLL
jgi:type II secretory pathway component PulF